MTHQNPAYWTTYSAILGSVLARRRAEIGADQRTMASNLQVSQTTWSRIERGESPITAPQLFEAAHFLGVPPSQFVAEADAIVADLRRADVKIYRHKPKEPSGIGLALAGAGALALAMSLLKKADDE